MIEVGEKVPEFNLKDTKGKKQSLYRLLQNGQVVLLFFPFAFSGACTEELCKVRDNMKIYRSLDATVIGISVDSLFVQEAFRKAQNLNFMLLSDFNKEVSRQFGVLNESYHEMKGVSKRSVFVIGKDGVIKHIEIIKESEKLPDFKAILSAISG